MGPVLQKIDGRQKRRLRRHEPEDPGDVHGSQLRDLGSECFGTVASESRASTSTSSILEDFVLSNFAECKAETTTTPLSEGKAIPEEGLNLPTDTAEASLLVKDKAEIN